MAKYKVKVYKGWYKARQLKANKDGACLYIEHHFNSHIAPKPNYAMVIVKPKCGDKTKQIAAKYCDYLHKYFDIDLYDKTGINVAGFNGRGVGSLTYCKMPALLVEPLFLSSEAMQSLIVEDWGSVKTKLVDALYNTITDFFPDGGTIALSVGHKYKLKPKHLDRGAFFHAQIKERTEYSWWRRLFYRLPKYRLVDRIYLEADLAEEVLTELRAKLESCI